MPPAQGLDKFQRVEYYYLANKETSSNFSKSNNTNYDL